MSIHGWAIYSVVGLSLAYFTYNRKMPLTLRSAFYPLLGNRIYGWIGDVIDIMAVLTTLFGLATTIGFGVGQINAGFTHVFGIPSFYFPYIDSEKAHEQTRKHLHGRFVELQKKHGLPADVRFKYIDKKEYSVVEMIEREAQRGSFDMIVISARGANNLTTLFIGSTTNDLLLSNQKMPLLVIKKR